MAKSVYSIVLDDNVVKGIDVAAAKQGTSRSNMINRILAQYVSVPTGETMVSDIYSAIDELLGGHSSLALGILGNGSIINLRSALRYKYNPAVKYTIELYEKSDYLGRLKVSLRSQNIVLLSILDDFFNLWAQMELSICGIKSNEFMIEAGKYSRLLRLQSGNFTQTGENIAKYVDLFDRCIQEYFNLYPASPQKAVNNVKQLYLTNINNQIIEL